MLLRALLLPVGVAAVYQATYEARPSKQSALNVYLYMGGCQNYGPFLGTLNIGCRIVIGI